MCIRAVQLNATGDGFCSAQLSSKVIVAETTSNVSCNVSIHNERSQSELVADIVVLKQCCEHAAKNRR